MQENKLSYKQREKIHEMARAHLRADNKRVLERFAHIFEIEERNLVGEIMNSPVPKWHSKYALEAKDKLTK